MLAVPSLNPNRLRGVDCAVVVVEVRPKPSWDQRTATVPKPIRARLRIAWTATCGSSAQAWTQRSPPVRAGSRTSAGKCGSGRSASGCRSAMPKRSRPSSSRNSPGPNPKVIVSPLGGSPIASPVSSGGRSSDPSTGPISPGRLAARHPLRGLGPLLEQRDQRVAGVGGDVERREVQPVLGRRGDAGLVLAAEREGPHRRAVAAAGLGSSAAVARPTANAPAAPAAAAPPPSSPRREIRPVRRPPPR